MTVSDSGGRPSADEPLDDVDSGLLDDIRDMFDATDPMPADLPERIRFFLALRDLEIEVARLVAQEDQPALAVRGIFCNGLAIGTVLGKSSKISRPFLRISL